MNNAWGYRSGCSLAEWAADEKCQLLCSTNVHFFSQVKAVENLEMLFLDNSYKCQNIGNVCFPSSFPFEYLLSQWRSQLPIFMMSLFSLGLPLKISVVPCWICCLSFWKTFRNRFSFCSLFNYFSATKVNLIYRLTTLIPSYTSFLLCSMCSRDNWSIIYCTSDLENRYMQFSIIYMWYFI